MGGALTLPGLAAWAPFLAAVGLALLTVRGEDAPGFKARIDRGTELANMGVMRSSFELLVLPALMLLATLVAFGV